MECATAIHRGMAHPHRTTHNRRTVDGGVAVRRRCDGGRRTGAATTRGGSGAVVGGAVGFTLLWV